MLSFNIKPSSTEEAVSGTLFEITEQELAAADEYEKDREYRRILVTLRSGVQAWVYRQEQAAWASGLRSDVELNYI